MKLLLYCTKAKLYLRDYRGKAIYDRFVLSPTDRPFTSDDKQPILNGKIVAECDYEVEEYLTEKSWYTKKLEIVNKKIYDGVAKYSNTEQMLENLLKDSCIGINELTDYMNFENNVINQKELYSIHIKNLHIFDEPQRLTRLTKINWKKNISECIAKKGKCNFGYSERYGNWIGCIKAQIDKAPQNMMRVIDWNGEIKIIISIKPEWLCKILNGEKSIEVRKKILKEML